MEAVGVRYKTTETTSDWHPADEQDDHRNHLNVYQRLRGGCVDRENEHYERKNAQVVLPGRWRIVGMKKCGKRRNEVAREKCCSCCCALPCNRRPPS